MKTRIILLLIILTVSTRAWAAAGTNFTITTYGAARADIPQNVVWLGADKTGVSNSQPAIQATLDALTNGGTVFIPQGRYLLNSRLHDKYGVSMIAQGKVEFIRNFTNGNAGGTLCIGPWLLGAEIAGGFDQYPATNQWLRITETNIASGTSSLTLESTNGLAVGDTVNIQAGHCVLDRNLPDWFGRARITAITNLTVYFSPPITRAVNYNATGGEGNPGIPHFVFKDRAPRECLIENIIFTIADAYKADAQIPGSGANIFVTDKGVTIRGCTFEFAPTSLILWGAEDVIIENCVMRDNLFPTEHVEQLCIGIRTWGAKNILARNLTLNNVVSLLYGEGSCENIIIENTHVNGVNQEENFGLLMAGDIAHGNVLVRNSKLFLNKLSLMTEKSYCTFEDCTFEAASGAASTLPTGSIKGKTTLKSPYWDYSLDDSTLVTETRTVYLQANGTYTNSLNIRGSIKDVWVKGFNITTNLTACQLSPQTTGVQDIDVLAPAKSNSWQRIVSKFSESPINGLAILLHLDSASCFVSTAYKDSTYSPKIIYTADSSLGAYAALQFRITYWPAQVQDLRIWEVDSDAGKVLVGRDFRNMPSMSGINIGSGFAGEKWGLQFAGAHSSSGYGHRLMPRDPSSGKTYLDIDYRNNGANWTTQVSFGSDGRVGIGSTNPASVLEVNGDIGFTAGGRAPRMLTGTTSISDYEIASNSVGFQNVTVTGAAVGDFALASFSVDFGTNIVVSAHANTTDNVRVTIWNPTGSTVSLTGNLKAAVYK